MRWTIGGFGTLPNNRRKPFHDLHPRLSRHYTMKVGAIEKQLPGNFIHATLQYTNCMLQDQKLQNWTHAQRYIAIISGGLDESQAYPFQVESGHIRAARDRHVVSTVQGTIKENEFTFHCPVWGYMPRPYMFLVSPGGNWYNSWIGSEATGQVDACSWHDVTCRGD